MLPMNESGLSLKERKNYTTLVFLLTNCPKVIKIFYDSPIIFDDFGI